MLLVSTICASIHMAVTSGPAGPVLPKPVFAMYFQIVHVQNFELQRALCLCTPVLSMEPRLLAPCM